MGGTGGPVQLADLGVSLNDALIDGVGQAERWVDLQEEDASQRWPANSSHRGYVKRKAAGKPKTQRSLNCCAFSYLMPPSETRCRGA